MYDQTRRTPIVIPVINEIGGGGSQNHPQNQDNRIAKDNKRHQSQPPRKFPQPQVPDSEANQPINRPENRSY